MLKLFFNVLYYLWGLYSYIYYCSYYTAVLFFRKMDIFRRGICSTFSLCVSGKWLLAGHPNWIKNEHMDWIDETEMHSMCEKHHIFVTFVTLVCWKSEDVSQARARSLTICSLWLLWANNGEITPHCIGNSGYDLEIHPINW